MTLGDMEDDRAGFEEDEAVFLIGRDLSERLEPAVRGLLHVAKRNGTDATGLPRFLQRPANAHVACVPAAAIRRAFKNGDGGDHRNALCAGGAGRDQPWAAIR